MTNFVDLARGIVVLDRSTHRADGRDGTNRCGSLLGAWPVPVLQIDGDGKLCRPIKRPGVRHHLVERGAAIKATGQPTVRAMERLSPVAAILLAIG